MGHSRLESTARGQAGKGLCRWLIHTRKETQGERRDRDDPDPSVFFQDQRKRESFPPRARSAPETPGDGFRGCGCSKNREGLE